MEQISLNIIKPNKDRLLHCQLRNNLNFIFFIPETNKTLKINNKRKNLFGSL